MEEHVKKDEPVKKRVDESWKEQAAREKEVLAHTPTKEASPAAPSSAQPTSAPADAGPALSESEASGSPEARFDLFVSSLAMEAFIAMGDIPHPVTRKQAVNLAHAKYLIDLLGVLDEKTKSNLNVDEERLLKDALYQLRMRYMAKAGA